MTPEINTGKKAREIRQDLELNQSQFWGRIGSTQESGSRYETGRDIPLKTQILLEIAYGRTPQRWVSRLRGEAT